MLRTEDSERVQRKNRSRAGTSFRLSPLYERSESALSSRFDFRVFGRGREQGPPSKLRSGHEYSEPFLDPISTNLNPLYTSLRLYHFTSFLSTPFSCLLLSGLVHPFSSSMVVVSTFRSLVSSWSLCPSHLETSVCSLTTHHSFPGHEDPRGPSLFTYHPDPIPRVTSRIGVA